MPRYIAFLRGINVGGHRVKMDRLRSLFTEAGHQDVATFIASGNVIFRSASKDTTALEAEIEAMLAAGLGYDVPTFVRTPEEVAQVARDSAAAALHDERAGSLYVVFMKTPPDSATRARLAALHSESDAFVCEGREVYWLIDGKLSESPLFGPGLEKALGGAANTMRNLTSLRKLLAKHGPES